MKIDLLCSKQDHPVNGWLSEWSETATQHHEVRILNSMSQLIAGDLLFLVSCAEVIPEGIRSRYTHTVVIHASDLPEGRGWSPHVWAILEGASTITVSAINAENRVDSGAIWAKRNFALVGHELHDEINDALFKTEMKLLDDVVSMVERGENPAPQPRGIDSYYPRRTPADSEIDADRSIAEQFEKIRVADPNRYPAFFKLRGHVYKMSIRKVAPDE